MRRPALAAFLLTTPLLFSLLVAGNPWVFRQPLWDAGDHAANSILVREAKEFRLLVGNYSRLHFNHPGPAFLYVLAAGETAFHDRLRIVPAPLNGQVLGLFCFNSLLAGVVMAMLAAGWRSLRAALAGLAVLLPFLGLSGVAATLWMPHAYCLPFAGLLVAATWVACGAGWAIPALAFFAALLVHGHVCFVLIAGGIALGTVALHWLRFRERPTVVLRRHPWATAAAIAILAAFSAPIMLHTLANFPGEFGKYAYYSAQGRSHNLVRSLRFLLQFWGSDGWWMFLAVPAAVWAAWRLAGTENDPVRRQFQRTVLVVGGAATLMAYVYAVRGIDSLRQTYTGYFYWMVPVLTGAAAAAALSRRFRWSPAVAVAALALLARPAAFHVPAPSMPDLGQAVALLRDDPRWGRERVRIAFTHDDWPLAIGIVAHLDRAGVPVVLDDPWWSFIATPRFVADGPPQPGDWRLWLASAPPPPAPGERRLAAAPTFQLTEMPPAGRLAWMEERLPRR